MGDKRDTLPVIFGSLRIASDIPTDSQRSPCPVGSWQRERTSKNILRCASTSLHPKRRCIRYGVSCPSILHRLSSDDTCIFSVSLDAIHFCGHARTWHSCTVKLREMSDITADKSNYAYNTTDRKKLTAPTTYYIWYSSKPTRLLRKSPTAGEVLPWRCLCTDQVYY